MPVSCAGFQNEKLMSEVKALSRDAKLFSFQVKRCTIVRTLQLRIAERADKTSLLWVYSCGRLRHRDCTQIFQGSFWVVAKGLEPRAV